ncbi:GNAT family N-acetyltransferase [Paenibacillus sp.]|uniref:GNAT family N-acetyltransferase n=1 Tax=Paenibacillus sp. TaxID=58172 RepID=UPI002836AA2D|nr:GNAT family N-acetyltransferase [Paenibacillus sp.]MDR0269541.1 GNAT family N-acetyltransferase [Paenibacillus sp.]
MSKRTIREAEIMDIQGLAHVHLNSWLTTYRGIVPDNYLDNLKLESRIELWTRVLDPSNGSMTFVLESPSGEIAGFINGGASRKKGLDIEAEVYSLYLLKEAQGKGHGRELMNRMIGYFREQRYRSMLVSVLEDNPAVPFYQKMGGRFLMSELLEISGEQVKELCMEWRNLDELA